MMLRSTSKSSAAPPGANRPGRATRFDRAAVGIRVGRPLAVAVVVLVAQTARAAFGADDNAAERTFFEERIRPVLVQHCYDCHSAEAAAAKKLKGGLRVDSREALRAGGESGPAVVPGDPDKSLLISALKHDSFQMPPKGRLPDKVVADFSDWIRRGAFDPRDGQPAPSATPAPIDFAAARREHWAFRPWHDVVVPEVRDPSRVRDPIDAFVLARLEAAGARLSPEADRRTLIRRASFDVIGLPPTPEEVESFAADESPDAYERLVDRLLASPHYGERWGRHWLDLARYADSSGYHSDIDRPQAWRYRDYVIRSFDDDKPYGRFVVEQLAGDELEDAGTEGLVATGFGRHGPSNDDNMGDKEQYRLDQLDGTISTTASVLLGLTLGCARCHDHKYDPLPAADYYRFLAVFDNVVPQDEPRKPPKPKTPEQAVVLDPNAPGWMALVETGAPLRTTHVLLRGDAKRKGPAVGPGVPQVLTESPVLFPEPASGAKTSGRRRALAEWIVSPADALAWRVLANRVWQFHFGRGLVDTPSNFGRTGSPPTHPELLEHLARTLLQHDGRLKPLHRRILLSATYRQSSDPVATGMRRETLDRLWARMPKRRLEAEILRDAILSVSGQLNLRREGPGIKPRIRPDLLVASQRNKWPVVKQEGPEHWRRSVYVYVKRQLLLPMLELFDAPPTTDSCAQRPTSTVPTQALVLMNDEFTEEQATHFAERARREAEGDVERSVARMQQIALGRPPAPDRLAEAQAFVQEQSAVYRSGGADEPSAANSALQDLAHVLFNSSEFAYVE